jgi:Na+/proline symporter
MWVWIVTFVYILAVGALGFYYRRKEEAQERAERDLPQPPRDA